MSNLKWEEDSQYFSGQGVALLGVLHPVTGAVIGYEPAGSVPDLKISIATSVIEHKNPQDGQRAIDARIQTQTNVKLMLTMESWKPANIARAIRGGYSKNLAGVVTAEALSVAPGLVGSLKKLSVSAVAVKQGATTLVDYTTAGAAWDYKLNSDAGSFKMNDGSVEAFNAAGSVITAVTVGATTVLTGPLTSANTAIGDRVATHGFTGANAADINGKTSLVTATSGTGVTLALNTATMTITTAAGSKAVNLESAIALTVDYSSAEQFTMEGLTQGLKVVPIRFEGLNTAVDNSPVVLEVFKFSTDPLKELALISDTFGQQVLEGSVLADNSQVGTGLSKYFRMRKLGR
jgi:hypothetical protein